MGGGWKPEEELFYRFFAFPALTIARLNSLVISWQSHCCL